MLRSKICVIVWQSAIIKNHTNPFMSSFNIAGPLVHKEKKLCNSFQGDWVNGLLVISRFIKMYPPAIEYLTRHTNV